MLLGGLRASSSPNLTFLSKVVSLLSFLLAAPGAAAGSTALLLSLVLVPSINGGAPGGAVVNIAFPPID